MASASKPRYTSDILMTQRVDQIDAMEMSDYFFLFSLFLVLWWSVDPLRFQLEAVPGIKRLPATFLVTNFAFIFLGKALFQYKAPRFSAWEAIRTHRFLVLFSMFVTLGSLYARFKSNIDETFLNMGVYTLMAPLMHWYTLNARSPWKLLRAIFALFILWSILALAVQFAYFRKVEIFHAREHIILPVAGAMLYYTPRAWLKVLGVLLVVVSAIAVSKITAFIIAALTLTYLLGLSMYRRLSSERDGLKSTVQYLGFALAIITAVGISFAAYHIAGQSAPSGNVGYRAHTYELAWHKFLASPIWGSGFTKAAVIDFDLFQVASQTQRLPTHSDPLDILAGGGVIAACLWLWGIFSKLYFGWNLATQRARKLPWAQEMIHQTMLMMVIGGVVVAAFNPILNIPNTAIAFWLALGCLCTTTTLLSQAPTPPAPTR